MRISWRRELSLEESKLRAEYKNTLMFLNRLDDRTATHFAVTVSLDEVQKHIAYGRTHLPVINTHMEILRAADADLDLYETFS